MSLTFWGNLSYSRTHLYSIDATTCVQRRSIVAKASLIPLIAKREELVNTIASRLETGEVPQKNALQYGQI